jgi:hypothetical protein
MKAFDVTEEHVLSEQANNRWFYNPKITHRSQNISKKKSHSQTRITPIN